MGLAKSRVYEIGSLYYTDRQKYDLLATPKLMQVAAHEYEDQKNPETGEMESVQVMNLDRFLGQDRLVAWMKGDRSSDGTSDDHMIRWGGAVKRDGTLMKADEYQFDPIQDPRGVRKYGSEVANEAPAQYKPILKRQAPPSNNNNPAGSNPQQVPAGNTNPPPVNRQVPGSISNNPAQGTTPKPNAGVKNPAQGTAAKPNAGATNPAGKMTFKPMTPGQLGDMAVQPPQSLQFSDPNEGRLFPNPMPPKPQEPPAEGQPGQASGQAIAAAAPPDPNAPSSDYHGIWSGTAEQTALAPIRDPHRPDFPWARYNSGPNVEAYRFNTIGGIPPSCETSGFNEPGKEAGKRNRFSVPVAFQIVIYRKGCAPGINNMDHTPPLACAPRHPQVLAQCVAQFPQIYGGALAAGQGIAGRMRNVNPFRQRPS